MSENAFNFDDIIIYEDDDVVVINKPQGLVVHHGAGIESGTLYDYLLSRYNGNDDVFINDYRLGIVHRLDKDTSGLMVVAKNKESADNLIEQFKNHTIVKKYKALAFGKFKAPFGEIDAPLARSQSNRKKFAVEKKGKGREAFTSYKVEKEVLYGKNGKNAVNLVDVSIKTGRTHQIRVHLSSIGHPIVNDTVYGKNRIRDIEALGLMLEAYSLTFVHPKTKEQKAFILPLAPKFETALNYFSTNF